MTRTSPAAVTARHSSIHGRGLFAARDLPGDQPVIEYLGEVIDWSEATARYDARVAADEDAASVTYFFDRGDGTVIDGGRHGNDARFINHGCEPNVEAVAQGDTIWIHTLRPVAAGEELLLDYALEVDELDDDVRALYACRCGAAGCRSTMLAAR